MNMKPKVSVILPSLNVEQYICQCVESVIHQSLKEIEIICVDSGSTDGTLEHLRRYVQQDERVKLIEADRKSYGYQMNLGIAAATGEYIGIVETDDWVPENMYEDLYNLATENQLDFIKADFYRFKERTDGEGLELDYNQLSKDLSVYGKVLNPQENIALFHLIMNTWSGIYRRQFLMDNNIWHNETPGASYQDNGFWFKTFALAQRVYFVNRPYYMNRRDNPNSSVHSKGKVYCMNEEYHYIGEFLNQNPELKQRLMPIYCFKKYKNYIFTYNRIAEEFKLGYIVRISEEFAEDLKEGALMREIFDERSWNDLMRLIEDPAGYYLDTSNYLGTHDSRSGQLARLRGVEDRLHDLERSFSFRLGRFLTFIPRKIRGGIRCIQENGMGYTISCLKEKFAHKFGR